ncbi:MAG TPA: nuclear transport factor 2 family protein [Ktedonobacteraceae bacterium]|nr:nuclear transport factor 2 family protein [Ktedonobacteraceae bacterium]
MHTEEGPEQLKIARAWIAAFNAHDVAALVALYAPDAELFDAGMKRMRRGRQEITDWFERRFSSLPEITYTPAEEIAENDFVAITWTVRGYTPRLLGLRWLARPFSVDGVSVFHLRNGLITRQRGYYDHLAVVERALPFLRLLPSRM